MIFVSFFLFNTLEADSNSYKSLFYDIKNIYEESNFKVYFNEMNSKELKNILNKLKVRVINYIIDDKEYYARNIDDLIYEYIENESLENKIYYEENGINIDGINITCELKELLLLRKLTRTY